MFRSPLKPSSGGSWSYFATLPNWNLLIYIRYKVCRFVAVCQLTFYNERKPTFQFSSVAKYGHGPPEDGFKGDRNM
jgi:hypothetical protein